MCVKLCRLNRICWWRVSHKHCTGKWEDHDCRRWKPNTSSKMRGFSIVKFVFGLAVECHCICHSLLPSHPDEQILARSSEQDALANNTRQGHHRQDVINKLISRELRFSVFVKSKFRAFLHLWRQRSRCLDAQSKVRTEIASLYLKRTSFSLISKMLLHLPPQ